MIPHSNGWPLARYCEIQRPYRMARKLTVSFAMQPKAVFGGLRAGARTRPKGRK
jgi:hypothetical protein